MSDRLYHIHLTPVDEANPETLAREISMAIHSLERGAENRPLPVALDWSALRIDIGRHPSLSDELRISASAPVL